MTTIGRLRVHDANVGGGQEVIYLVVGRRSDNVFGYVWRIYSHGTSFYAMAREPVLGVLKVSLHGPDPRFSGPRYRVDRVADADASKAALQSLPGGLPATFDGEKIASGVRRVLRLRSSWMMFRPPVLSGPMPSGVNLRRTQLAGVIPPSDFPNALDIDVYVSDREPFWPNARRASLDKAAFGPLVNDLGQSLTAVAVLHSEFQETTPPQLQVNFTPLNRDDRVRGIVGAIDRRGFYVLYEDYLSRSKMTAKDKD